MTIVSGGIVQKDVDPRGYTRDGTFPTHCSGFWQSGWTDSPTRELRRHQDRPAVGYGFWPEGPKHDRSGLCEECWQMMQNRKHNAVLHLYTPEERRPALPDVLHRVRRSL